MDQHEVEQLITSLRRDGDDGQRIEAKAARGGVPHGLDVTMCAFANAGGGIILLGIDQQAGFDVVGVSDAGAAVRSLQEAASTRLAPPLAPEIETHDIGGSVIVSCVVAGVPRSEQPVEVRGVGAYIRSGDANRALTGVQIQAMVGGRSQPRFDVEPVLEARLDALDAEQVARYIQRVRAQNPDVFGATDDDEILLRTNVTTVAAGGVIVPTIAGLLAMGTYPQQFLPQLNVTFVEYATTDASPIDGRRFLDNARFDGPIPTILSSVLKHVESRLRRRAVIDAAGHRRDELEYPNEALRELIANALVHRELAPWSRGTQVTIELYPDRIVIGNPGGLFGSVSLDTLGDPGLTSSRNAALIRILEDVEARDGRMVVENRASGIYRTRQVLRDVGIEPPLFEDDISRFGVTMHPAALLDVDVRSWLDSIGAASLKPSLKLALVQMRRGLRVTNESYRRDSGVDSTEARADLRSLVERELARPVGVRRWTRYELGARATEGAGRIDSDRDRKVFDAIRGETTRVQIEERSGMPRASVLQALNSLIDRGLVQATAPPKSKLRKYVRVPGSDSTLF